MRRRRFLAGLAGAAGYAAGAKRYRAAIIGHTRRGDYGHEWDTAWSHFDSIEVVAVADPMEAGRRKAMQRSGAQREYGDYREMLRKEKPDLVGIFPRWIDQRLEMVTAAAESGAHILMEKPFARDLEEADRMVKLAELHRIKIQVGHTARPAPVTLRIKEMVANGDIGTLLEIRSRGKEDRRAGGEDLMVLGTHVFDLMRVFAGDPKWVFAHVTQSNEEIGPRDVREATEPIGPIAGDQIAATFAFGGGVHGYFASMANDQRSGARFGVTLCGSKGLIHIPLSSYPSGDPYILHSASWIASPDPDGWRKIEMPAAQRLDSREKANAVMVSDLLAAIEQGKEPCCGARDGRWAIEMALGVYESQKTGGRVPFPLRNRRHPLRG